MRLIDAERLTYGEGVASEYIHVDMDFRPYILVQDLIKVIEESPTAFDSEKVFAMLEELHNYSCFPTEWVGVEQESICKHFEKELKKILDYISKFSTNENGG